MIVAQKKGGSLRIVLDPRPLNTSAKRAHFLVLTIDKIAFKMYGAKLFCRLDTKSDFWMLPEDANSKPASEYHGVDFITIVCHYTKEFSSSKITLAKPKTQTVFV